MSHPVTDNSLSIIVPAYNEEENIEITLNEVFAATAALPGRFEVIVVNDGSKDRTLEIARRMAERHPEIRIINNEKNVGFGGAFMQGIKSAQMGYSMLVCGDNGAPSYTLRRIFANVGKADLVLPYYVNQRKQIPHRRILSKLYVKFLNALTGYRLTYYNGTNVFPTETLKRMTSVSPGFGYAAQCVVTLLNSGYSYTTVPVVNRFRMKGKSTALDPKNVVSVLKTLFRLVIRENRFRSHARANRGVNLSQPREARAPISLKKAA